MLLLVCFGFVLVLFWFCFGFVLVLLVWFGTFIVEGGDVGERNEIVFCCFFGFCFV